MARRARGNGIHPSRAWKALCAAMGTRGVMPQVCSICRHTKRTEIDAALVRPDSLRAIAGRFGTSKSALERHRDKCLPAHLLKAKDDADLQSASALVAEIREITRKTSLILSRAMRKKDSEVALKAIARLERQLELKARLLGELEERGGVGGTTIQVVYVDKQLNLGGRPAAQIAPVEVAGELPTPAAKLDTSSNASGLPNQG
jgi:hypothetical protein